MRAGLLLLLAAPRRGAAAERRNVLFIGVDDLRPDIAGAYGQRQVLTPGLERLQKWGTTFNRAYCQVALCSPSRTSLLTGLRPDTSKVWAIGPYFRTTMGARGGRDVTRTLPQWFRLNGYNVSGAGKIFHPGSSSGGPSGSEGGGDGGYPFDPSGSWSRPYFFCDQFYNGTLQSPAMQQWPGARGERAGCVQSDACVKCLDEHGSLGGKPAWKAAPCDADCYPDGAVATEVVRQLHEQRASLDGGGAPFFVACGFKRPHLGWFAPQEYFDMYNVSDVVIAKNRAPPPGMPKVAFSGNGEMCGMGGAGCKTVGGYRVVPDERHAEFRRAYYASVSFMDSQLGRVLDAVEELDLRGSTAIVFWGDHGYQLGEHGEWAKVTNFELATRVPLIFAAPGGAAGAVSDALVEHLDIYPTLVDIAGLPPPADASGAAQLEGRSLLPLLDGSAPAAAFNASFSQIQRPGNKQGLTVRTQRWRYTEWVPFDYSKGLPVRVANNTDVELYDHSGDGEADFDAFENANVAGDPASAAVAAELSALLWQRHAAPPPPPPPPQVRLQLGGSCLVAGDDGDDVLLGSCGGAGAAWAFSDTGVESGGRPGMCLNVYGGAPGCKEGQRVHLATCGRVGDRFAWAGAAGGTGAVSATGVARACDGLCLSATASGGSLSRCADAAAWTRAPAA